jgi:hypothetical protein
VAGDIPLFISSTLRNTMSSTGVSIPVFTSKEDMRAFSRSKKREGLKVALVPTMVGTCSLDMTWRPGMCRSNQGPWVVAGVPP